MGTNPLAPKQKTEEEIKNDMKKKWDNFGTKYEQDKKDNPIQNISKPQKEESKINEIKSEPQKENPPIKEEEKKPVFLSLKPSPQEEPEENETKDVKEEEQTNEESNNNENGNENNNVNENKEEEKPRSVVKRILIMKIPPWKKYSILLWMKKIQKSIYILNYILQKHYQWVKLLLLN